MRPIARWSSACRKARPRSPSPATSSTATSVSPTWCSVPLEQVFGASIGKFLPAAEGEILRAMLDHGSGRYQTRLVLNGQESHRGAGDAVEHRARRRRASHADPERHQLAGAGAAREPLEGRIPRDAGARAAQSARRHPGRGACARAHESDRTDGAARDRHHQAPGGAHGAPGGRPARRRPRGHRQDRAEARAGESRGIGQGFDQSPSPLAMPTTRDASTSCPSPCG